MQFELHAFAFQQRPLDSLHFIQTVLNGFGPFSELFAIVGLGPDGVALDGRLNAVDLMLLHLEQLTLACQLLLLIQDITGIIAAENRQLAIFQLCDLGHHRIQQIAVV
ncbi:hypothetical protein SDC9_72543 [bioreactor metagenome]|uniref:Uncharacterized protein n=1 Tax=bioreactor metagenome TaxID=1076179 RepID=A0A644YBP7_9ZZZZ